MQTKTTSLLAPTTKETPLHPPAIKETLLRPPAPTIKETFFRLRDVSPSLVEVAL